MVTGAGSPANGLSTGIPGVGEIHPGTHLCALYSGSTQREQLLAPYLQEGLRHGDRCHSFPVGEVSGAQLVSVLAFTPTSASEAPPLLRIAVDMSGVAQEPGVEMVPGLETSVMQVLAARPAVFLCLYDLQLCGAGELVDALSLHSRLLIDGAVLDNPRRTAPERCPTPEPGAVSRDPVAEPGGGVLGVLGAGDRWLLLTSTEARIAALVATGMTNRATADRLIVSHHTVDAHLKHIYVKLGIHSRVQLTVLALQHGAPGV